jgi:ATP-dependent protease ClpP protease subunit
MNKKFYEFKNITSSEADLFIYGEIVQEKSVDWWTGEESKTDVGLMDFKEQLDNIGNVQKLNIYINSPGGDVFTASTMISMLQRLKDKGTTINAYVDGLSASAASFLMMVADNVNLYKNSTVMVHKPMSYAVGNANDMQKTIDALNKIEESVMMPMYMNKSKVSEEEIKSLIDAETWLSANEMDKYFNVTLLDEEKTAVASISSNLFKNYKNVPDFIKNSLKKVQNEEKTEENAQKNEEIVQNEPIQEEKPIENSENETISTENQSKEQEIKARLKLVNISLKLKEIEEREDD